MRGVKNVRASTIEVGTTAIACNPSQRSDQTMVRATYRTAVKHHDSFGVIGQRLMIDELRSYEWSFMSALSAFGIPDSGRSANTFFTRTVHDYLELSGKLSRYRSIAILDHRAYVNDGVKQGKPSESTRRCTSCLYHRLPKHQRPSDRYAGPPFSCGLDDQRLSKMAPLGAALRVCLAPRHRPPRR